MARTDPGLGGPPSQDEESGARPAPKDPVDAVLEGFGAHRPDRPRVRPVVSDITPLPARVKSPQALVSTAPGQRQRKRRAQMILGLVLLVALVTIGLAFMKITRT